MPRHRRRLWRLGGQGNEIPDGLRCEVKALADEALLRLVLRLDGAAELAEDLEGRLLGERIREYAAGASRRMIG